VSSATGRRRAPVVEPLQSASGSSTPSGGARQVLLRSASSPAVAEKLARAARTFDRELALTFKSKEVKKQGGLLFESQEFHAGAASRWAVPLDQGLALSTRFQNFKKDQYKQQFDGTNGQGANSDQTGAMTEAAAAAQAEIEAIAMVDKQGFADDVKHITNDIEDLSRSIRLEHLEKNSPEERHNAAKEEARRRKEAELRRARKKEQMARDPKRKVALRLENRRRSDDLDAMSASPKKGKPGQRVKQEIPMMKVEAKGEGGKSEKVTIVDVLKIKQQCTFLDGSSNVDDMLREREREERWEREMNRGDMSNTSLSRLFQSSEASVHLLDKDSFSELSKDERIERAALMRDEVQARTLIAKMETMRSEWSYAPCCNLTVVTSASGKKTLSLGKSGAVDKRASSKFQASDIADLLAVEEPAPTEGNRRASRRSSVRKGSVVDALTATEETAAIKKRQSIAFAARQRRQSQMEAEELAAFQALRKKVSRNWNVIRSVVRWSLLLFKLRKKDLSAELVKMLLKQAGEFARLRRAVKMYITSVKLIQRSTRAFLQAKKKRCQVMDKEWVKVEEHHLAVFFRHQAAMIVKDQKDMMAEAQGAWQVRKAKEKAVFLQMMQAGVEGGNIAIDTGSQKIPVKERRAVIGRYYNYALRRHVRNSKLLIDTVMDTLKARKDLHRFLQSLGADENPTSLLGDVSTTPTADFPYNHLPEDMILNLISRCAQALAHVSTFQDHPANQAIPEHRRKIIIDYNVGSDPQGFAKEIIDMMDRPYFKGRLGRHPSERADNIIAEEEMMVGTKAIGKAAGERRKSQSAALVQIAIAPDTPDERLDVEEVFQSFTPRLKDIVEEQAQEYKESASVEAAAEDASASLAPLADSMEVPDVNPPDENE